MMSRTHHAAGLSAIELWDTSTGRHRTVERPDSTGPHQYEPHSTKWTHVQTADTVHSRHEAGYACDIHWTRIAEASGVQRPEQRQKKQNAFETVMPRAWPVKMLGLLLAIVAVVLMSEILSVLLNLPEDRVGVLRRFG